MPTITSAYRIYRNKLAAEFLGVSRATYWRLIKRGDLPAPVQITKQISGQPEHVLVAYIERRSRGGRQ